VYSYGTKNLSKIRTLLKINCEVFSSRNAILLYFGFEIVGIPKNRGFRSYCGQAVETLNRGSRFSLVCTGDAGNRNRNMPITIGGR
jgi:hypothetical protein